jgi:hypothetical protein
MLSLRVVRASVAYDPAYDPATVRAAMLELLSSTYSFANRDFGQVVSADEVTALLLGVQGGRCGERKQACGGSYQCWG